MECVKITFGAHGGMHLADAVDDPAVAPQVAIGSRQETVRWSNAREAYVSGRACRDVSRDT